MSWTVTQPWRGIFGLAVCFMIAMGISSGFTDIHIYTGLMGMWAVACVAPEIVMGMVWGGTWPAEKLENPHRGLALTALMFIMGCLALWWITFIVGGGGLNPAVSAFLIMTVVVVIWMVAGFGCWPFSAFKWPGWAVGFSTLITAYLIDLVIWKIFFNYDAIAAVPVAFGGMLEFVGVSPSGIWNGDSCLVFMEKKIQW